MPSLTPDDKPLPRWMRASLRLVDTMIDSRPRRLAAIAVALGGGLAIFIWLTPPE